MTVRAFITTFDRRAMLEKTLNKLAGQFNETVVLDNSVKPYVPDLIRRSSFKVFYNYMGRNVGFDRNLAEGLLAFYSNKEPTADCFDFLCGDDDLYSRRIGAVLRQALEIALNTGSESLPSVLIIGHTNYGSLEFNLKQIAKAALGKDITMMPSGAAPISHAFLSRLGKVVWRSKAGSLWKIDDHAMMVELLILNGLPRYIGIGYRNDVLLGFLRSSSRKLFYNTYHLYSAPLAALLFNNKLQSVYYFLPSASRPLLAYKIGAKDWDKEVVFEGLSRFYESCSLLSLRDVAPSPNLISRDEFMKFYAPWQSSNKS